MNLELDRVDSGRRVVLERLLQLKLYEGGMEPGPDGLIDRGESLDKFFSEPRCIPFFFKSKKGIVGFALIKIDQTLRGPDGLSNIVMNLIEEFYVTRPWRRKGIGTSGAHMIFDRYPRQWVITTWPDDARVRFWRHVVTEYKRGHSYEFCPGEHRGFPGQFVWVVDISGENTTSSNKPLVQS